MEILVALLLAALVFLAIPSGDIAQNHRDLKSTLDNLERAVQFASNEAVLRNSVVRLRLNLEKNPLEYFVEFGPPGNIPLPEKIENEDNLSLAQKNEIQQKASFINQQFNKVEEFEDSKPEIPMTVSLIGTATTAQKGIITSGDANIYFYPTGEKDGALVFLSTNEEMAYLQIEPFLTDNFQEFKPLDTSSVAKPEDLLQTKMDEVYREWNQ